jgi:hypothetical protein
MKITSDLTNLTTAILILTVQMFIEWTLLFLFFNESKTAFIKTISSCRYVTSIKPKIYLCLNKNNL